MRTRIIGWFSGLTLWVRLAIGVVVVLLVVFAALRLPGAIKYMIFGDVGAKKEHANTVVAQQQTGAEANIADNTIQTVHERDVYREHITQVVHEGQEKVNAADRGQQMDPQLDAAIAAGLCGVHDSLCRRASGPAPLQPVR